VKIGLGFVFFFVLFYVEPLPIGSVPFAVLWKALLFAVLLIGLYISPRGRALPRLTVWGLLLFVAGFFNESLAIDPFETASTALKNAYIPILFGFWLYSFRDTEKGEYYARRFIIVLSAFILLSTTPFLLNLLSPLESGYDLSLFGGGDTVFGFVGIFQNAHGASMTLTVASATLLWALPYARTRTTRMFYLALMAVGLVASFLTLVRTGLAMFASALLVLLASSRKRIHFRLALVLVIASVPSAVYLFETSEVFRLRMLGLNVLMARQDVTLNQLGSGRFLYWTTALGQFFSSPFQQQIFGFGPTLAKEYMFGAIGLRIYAHNGFIDILQFHGYFGLFAYAMMLREIFRILLTLPRSNPYFTLLAMHLTAYLIGMLVQGERYFLVDVLFALSIVCAKLSASFSAEENYRRRNDYFHASAK
tara:strand:- start:1632 stop:2894 length:1263 start_codon:yes stop_codon:yes gene_type:complete